MVAFGPGRESGCGKQPREFLCLVMVVFPDGFFHRAGRESFACCRSVSGDRR